MLVLHGQNKKTLLMELRGLAYCSKPQYTASLQERNSIFIFHRAPKKVEIDKLP